MTTTAVAAHPDERVRQVGWLRILIGRPELAAVLGAIVVWLLFAIWSGTRGFLTVAGTANYLEIAAQLGMLGAVVSLLVISGEFDLSIGSMIGATGMILALAIAHYNLPVWVGVLAAFTFALTVGFINGFLVVRTGLPSFIITLAAFFGLRGLALAMARLLTGTTVVGQLESHTAGDFVTSLFTANVNGFAIVIVWWAVVAAICHRVLMHTQFGNWIFGCGGSASQARNLGVPVERVKVILFMSTASVACLLAVIQVLDVGSADANRGVQKEFEAIITAVIGGTLLSGGYGTVIGTIFGALTLAITQQGLFFAAVDAEWYRVSLAAILLSAVLLNQYVRTRAMRSRG
jgi:simple sugar transport system permease protein